MWGSTGAEGRSGKGIKPHPTPLALSLRSTSELNGAVVGDLPVLESAIEPVLTNLPVCFGNEARPSIRRAREFRKSA